MSFETLHVWNRRWTARIPVFAVFTLATVATFAVIGSYLYVRNFWQAPPSTSGDEPVYDSIAWELSRGNGYEVDYTDSDFRRPYEQANRPLELATRYDNIPDTVRPPLFPLIISLIDRLLGRQFLGIRLWNLFCLSITIGMCAVWLNRRHGILAVLLLIPFATVLDVRTRLYSRAILTEATSALIIALLIGTLLKLFEAVEQNHQRTAYRWTLFSGIVTTASLYTRSNVLLWLPVIAISIGWHVYQKTDLQPLKKSAIIVVLFSMMVVIGYAPWAIRNLLTTQAFMPFGTQGGTQLSAAWGDEIWKTRGIWNNLHAEGFFDSLEDSGVAPMEHRVALAHYSQVQARTWIVQNPGKAFLLIPLKIGQEFRPRSWSEATILLLVLIGLWKIKSSVARRVFLSLFLATALGIGMTWSVEGRFLVPLLFVWHCLAISGLSHCLGLNSGEKTESVTVS